jgi:hypothetical protein
MPYKAFGENGVINEKINFRAANFALLLPSFC